MYIVYFKTPHSFFTNKFCYDVCYDKIVMRLDDSDKIYAFNIVPSVPPINS